MRFAIIGGEVIAPSHAKAIIGNAQAELGAIADTVVEKVNKLAAEYSVPHVYADYEELLKRDDIDAITVVSAPSEPGVDHCNKR